MVFRQFLPPSHFPGGLVGGIWLGIVVSVVCSLSWLAADLAAGHIYSNPVIPYWNMTVRFSTFVVVTYALVQLRKVLEREKNYARLDCLIGAANNRNFVEKAQAELQKARAGGYAIALAYLDLDNFNGINDNFGHSVGDQLLKIVAEIIKKNYGRTTWWPGWVAMSLGCCCRRPPRIRLWLP
jgi:hypothetical protein